MVCLCKKLQEIILEKFNNRYLLSAHPGSPPLSKIIFRLSWIYDCPCPIERSISFLTALNVYVYVVARCMLYVLL